MLAFAVATDPFAMIPSIPPSDEVKSALAKFAGAMVTPVQMAVHLGYKQDVIDMIDMFWEPTFNRGWLYLADEIILGHLTDETGKNAIANFCKVLTDGHKNNEGVKWQQVGKNHPLVQKYLSSYSLKNGNRPHSPFPNKKRCYVVTGSFYKELLAQSKSQSGAITRTYFLMIEDLARYQQEYIRIIGEQIMRRQMADMQAQVIKQITMTNEVATQLAEEKKAKDAALQLAMEAEQRRLDQERKTIEEKSAAIAAERARQSKEKEEENKQFLYDRDSYAYIAISEDQAPRYSFKIGSVETDTDKALAKRLTVYKTGHDAQATHFYTKKVHTYNAPLFDHIVRKLLAHRKNHGEKTSELTRGPFYKLADIMDRMLFHYEKMHEIALEDIRTMHTDMIGPRCDEPVPRLEIHVDEKWSTAEILQLSDTERIALMAEFIENYMTTKNGMPWSLATGLRPSKSIWPDCREQFINWLNPSNKSFNTKPFKDTINALLGFNKSAT